MTSHVKTHSQHVVIVAFNGCQILDVTGPMQVFASLNERVQYEHYRITLVGTEEDSATATCGLQMTTVNFNTVAPETIDTLVIAGGNGTLEAAENHALIAWVKKSAETAQRVCSVCTGTFILAAAGLTTGKRVSTHWNYAKKLEAMYPSTIVTMDAIYVRDGNLWSSAGVTAGIDMTLALIEEDNGHKAAMTIARHLVVYAHRPGNQSQFSTLLKGQSNTGGKFTQLISWMVENLEQTITVEDMAEKAGMSGRSFQRRFSTEIGVTPAKYLERLRLDSARALLEGSSEPLKSIAAQSGFVTPVRFIQVFERCLGMSPTAYRHLHGQRH